MPIQLIFDKMLMRKLDLTIIVMSSVRLPWRSKAINSTWNKSPQAFVIFTESNRSYYEANENDQFEQIRKKNIFSEWITLVDDDTYVNIPRMKQMLNKLDSRKDMLIGHVLTPFKCLWGGSGMILSQSAFRKLKYGLQRNIMKKVHSRRNDIIIVKYAQQLNISILHSNLIWGNPIPEASDFVNQMKNKYESFESSVKGVVSLHKMCPDITCAPMYAAHKIISKKESFDYKIII